MKQLDGNLLDMAENGDFDVIIHGCNCFNTMGAGIADQIRKRYPGAYLADCTTTKGNYEKLGNFTSYVQPMSNGNMFVIINAYTQFGFSSKKMNVDYRAIQSVMRTINKIYAGKRIGYPMIGAGLAGGDWGIISKIIDIELTDVDHTLIVYKP